MKGRRFIHWRTVWPILFVAAGFLGIACFAGKLGIDDKDIIPSALLASTLVAVVWYSVETRSMRLEQVERTELTNHPWLHVEFKESLQRQIGDTLESEEKYKFIIHNTGHTPAHEVTVRGHWLVRAGHGAIQPSQDFDYQLGVIMPSRGIPFDVIIQWELVSQINIEFELSYFSGAGGGGTLIYKYSFEQPDKKMLSNESLRYWLSDGKIKPNAPIMIQDTR